MNLKAIFVPLMVASLLSACGEGGLLPSAKLEDASGTTTSQNAQGQFVPGQPGQPPEGFGPGPGGPGGPGGLPPNFEQIQAEYPELAAALEEMQDLDPETRRTQMDALFAEHPEWQAVLMPPGGGMGGPGGPGGQPPGAPPEGFAPPTQPTDEE